MYSDNSGGSNPGTGTPEVYKPGQLEKIEAYLTVTPGLGDSLVPVVKRLAECGFSKIQLDAIVAVPCDESKIPGRTNKVGTFLEGVVQQYETTYLKKLSRDYKAFIDFLDVLKRTEAFREDTQFCDEAHEIFKLPYDLCISMMDELEEGRARELVSDVKAYCNTINGSNAGRVLYILNELMRQNKESLASMDVLFAEFKRNEKLCEGKF